MNDDLEFLLVGQPPNRKDPPLNPVDLEDPQPTPDYLRPNLETLEVQQPDHNNVQENHPDSQSQVPNPDVKLPLFRKIVDDYETKLWKTRWLARVVGLLLGFARFLGYCGLTWATVVLLGGFVSSLRSEDFRIVTVLLLLEAGRLASAIFFSRLVKRAVTGLTQSLVPKEIHLGQRNINRVIWLAWIIRGISLAGQVAFISPSIVLPIQRLKKGSEYRIAAIQNLIQALTIFYYLVLVNAVVALTAVVCALVVLCSLFEFYDQSFVLYYDEILDRAFDQGIVVADDFDFFDFAFTMLARQTAQYVQPRLIPKYYQNLINYLYAHKKGCDEIFLRLDADKFCEQEAAIHLVGLWARQKLLKPPVKLEPKVFTKLADKLGTGQLGWAAANSFRLLTIYGDRRMVFRTRDSSGKRVLDILVDLLNPSNGGTLVMLRALVGYYKATEDALSTNLVQKLWKILKGSKLHRMRVYAAYLLKIKSVAAFDLKQHVGNIYPLQDHYFLEEEKEMLDELREFVKLSSLNWDGLGEEGFRIISDS